MKTAIAILTGMILSHCVFTFANDSIVMPTKGIFAHRGSSKNFPENTLKSLLAAVQAGAHGVEFDIRVTKDKKLVLMHDPTVDRTTNGTGHVRDLTLAQIKKLDAGSWKDIAFRGEQVPTFYEALNAMPTTIWLNIHIKNSDAVPEIAKAISESGRQHQALIACWEEDMEVARRIDSTLKLINMTRLFSNESYVEKTIQLEAFGIQFNGELSMVEQKDVTRALQAGLVTFNSGIDKPKKIAELFKRGIDFVLADDPVEALEIFYAAHEPQY